MLRSESKRMAKFLLVGVLNTGVDFAVFVALTYGAGMASGWAQPISYGCGLANSYWLNRRWTFASRRRIGAGELLRFAATNALSFAAATAVLLACESGLGWSPAAAKLVSIVASLAVNYAGNRLWVFREPAGQPERQRSD